MPIFLLKPIQVGMLLLALLFIALSQSPILRDWDEAVHIEQMQWAERAPSQDIVVVQVDDTSVAALGGWPISRAVYAEVFARLAAAEPALIVNTLLFDQPQSAALQTYFTQLQQHFEASTLVNGLDPKAWPDLTVEVKQLGVDINRIAQHIEMDQVLVKTLNKIEMIQVVAFALDKQPDGLDNIHKAWILNPNPLPHILARNSLKQVSKNVFTDLEVKPRAIAAILPPISQILNAAHTWGGWVVGDLDARTNSQVRSTVLFQYHKTYLPSLSMVIAARALDVPLSEIKISLGQGVHIGSQKIITDSQSQIYPFLYNADFKSVSLAELYQGKVDFTLFKDKIILLGLTSMGGSVPTAAMWNAPRPPVLDLAQQVSNLLEDDVLHIPMWALWAQLLAFMLVFVYLTWGFTRLPWYLAWLATGLLAAALMSLQYIALVSMALWLSLFWTVVFLGMGSAILSVHQLWAFAHLQAQRNAEATEAHRLLGLAYQGQGRLDEAFVKYMLCPVDSTILSMLYNLALDFERRRELKAALKVYDYIHRNAPDYRDVEQRILRIQTRSQSLGKRQVIDSLSEWLDDHSELRKPMLGRYRVDKKLAKGAMGVLYLGRDEKMDRLVALKTLALSEEFEGDELQDATTRFFREAAASGRLTHEHIIAVYDAGEENKLAYIAMEFFKGGNLSPFTRKENLLPLDRLCDIGIKASEALHYAHSQGVIHRDIKPANILFNPATNMLKLTDFGIARIIDSKKTKTGVVLGTPSYMAPEQLAGKVVDGRADLYALGVTLFQMSTGELPFHADSMASLMFKITNETHPDVLAKRDTLPDCWIRIIDSLLAKEAEQRFIDGATLAAELRSCRDEWISQQSADNNTAVNDKIP